MPEQEASTVIEEVEEYKKKKEAEHVQRGSTFKDKEGREWKLLVTTRKLYDACDYLEVTLAVLLRYEIPISGFLDLAYVLCEEQCEERRMSFDDFLDAIPPHMLPSVVQAVQIAFYNAFPQAKEIGDGPFGNGSLETFLNSVLRQE